MYTYIQRKVNLKIRKMRFEELMSPMLLLYVGMYVRKFVVMVNKESTQPSNGWIRSSISSIILIRC